MTEEKSVLNARSPMHPENLQLWLDNTPYEDVLDEYNAGEVDRKNEVQVRKWLFRKERERMAEAETRHQQETERAIGAAERAAKWTAAAAIATFLGVMAQLGVAWMEKSPITPVGPRAAAPASPASSR